MARAPLAQQVVQDLRQEILRGRFTGAERLPSEPELARLFQVSRPTLREALRVLETEGLLRRRHGVGTFVRPRGAVTAGVERLQSFTETIRQAGYPARDQVLEIRPVRLRGAVATRLGARPGEAGVLVRSLRWIGRTPVIYCEDTLPASLVADPTVVELRRRRESLLDFFRLDLGLEVRYARLALEAIPAAGRVARALAVAAGQPLLRLVGTAYDAAERPLYATDNHVRTARYRFFLIRR